MIFSINFKQSAFANPGGKGADTIEESVATIFHEKFKGSMDYKNSDVLVNFEHSDGDNPASATILIDLDNCKEINHVFTVFQKAFVEYMRRTTTAIHQQEPITVMPVDPETGAIG